MVYKSVFIKNGKFYILESDKYESLERFNERGWFIASLSPNNDSEIEDTIQLSRIWANIKFNKCIYDDVLMNKINNIITKISNN